MDLDPLIALLQASPTPGAAAGALAALRCLAREGDASAREALCRALGQAMGVAPPVPGRPWQSPALQAYALAWLPRALPSALSPVEPPRPGGVPQEAVQQDFLALQHLVRIRHPLQHEALKARVLDVLGGFGDRVFRFDAAWWRAMSPLIDKVLDQAQVVEGSDSDSSLQFGRDKLLAFREPQGLDFVIAHELGHNVLDRSRGRGAALSAAVPQPDWPALAAALPGLLRAGREHGGPLAAAAGDARVFEAPDGLRLLCSHARLPAGGCFHLSLSWLGAPLDRAVGERVAFCLLRWAAAEPARAVLAWSPRGLLHLGWRSDGTGGPVPVPAAEVQRVVDESAAEAAGWAAALAAGGRVGRHERDIACLLGLLPRQPVFCAGDARTAAQDLQALRQAYARGLAQRAELGLDDAAARPLLAAAWRAADAPLLRRLLAERPADAARLRAAPWPLAAVGSSLGALREADGAAVRVLGPTAADILATLHVLHDSGLSLDTAAAPGDPDGRSLLQRAAALDAALVRDLLAAGADPRHAAADGTTALMHAADAAVVAALAGAGADVDAQAADGGTALMHAARQGFVATLQALLAAGADVDLADALGATALHHAAVAAGGVDAEACALALLAAGAEVDEEDAAGATPLLLAVERGREALARCLLAHGANPQARARDGRTAAAVARTCPVGTMAALLGAAAESTEEPPR